MEALRNERRQDSHNSLQGLGLSASYRRVTEAAVQDTGFEANLTALPPDLTALPAQNENGDFYFVLGISSASGDDYLA